MNLKFKVGEKVIYHKKTMKGLSICISEIQEIKIGNYGVVYIVDNERFVEKDLYSYEKNKTMGLSFLQDIMLDKER